MESLLQPLIKPLNPVIGAEVSQLSLADIPTSDTVELIEHALEKYGVLIIPQQDITPAQQVAFSEVFATLERTTHIDARHAQHPEIFIVGNTGKKLVTFAPAQGSSELEWHADHMQLETPARASMLYCRQSPAIGGDTLFACMYSAYDALNKEGKARADSLNALHSISGLNQFLQDESEEGAAEGRTEAADSLVVCWPLVRTHARSGRKSLYFGSRVTIGIEGWEEKEARAYLTALERQATQPKFCFRHQWSVGDAVIWDNRRVIHAGTPYDVKKYQREMHRTTFREDQPIV